MSMYKSLSLKQTADLIEAVGDKQTVLAQGEMGIGKSSILKMLRERPAFKNHFFCYVDITTKDVGDFLVPKIKTVYGNVMTRFRIGALPVLRCRTTALVSVSTTATCSRSVRATKA